MKRWSVLALAVGGMIGVALVRVAGDLYMQAKQERRRELDLMLGLVSRTVSDIVSPPPIPPYAMVGDQLMPEPPRVVNLPDGSTAVVTPAGVRPGWAGPLPFSEDDAFDDPTDLDQPFDRPENWPLMQAGTLDDIHYVDPAPEVEGSLSGNGRTATFAPGENPLADIGEEPTWHSSE